MDRAFLDFERLYHMHLHGGFFVLRAAKDIKLRRLYSSPVDRNTGVIFDQVVRPAGNRTSFEYPDHI
ncbi:MAG: hypothetical protein OXC62_15605 [Aestuariivita sp.]|nr:hypothetical protein [Aestuariivita sp.]